VTPLVSVCIPVYNSEHHLADTIRSVLAQTLEDFELIIVDDCSTDRSLEVARSFADPRIRLSVNGKNLGGAANWERTCAAASGTFVKLLCGDDLIYPNCLALQVEAFGHPGSQVALVASRRDIIDSSGRVLLARRGLAGMPTVVRGEDAIRRAVRSGTNPFGEPACVLMRRNLLDRARPFRPLTQYMMDLDMWCRLLSYGDLYAIQEPLAAFRVQNQSWSHAVARHQSVHAQALFFELRRDLPGLISGWDVLQGSVRATSLGLARRTSYRLLNLPGRIDGRNSKPSAPVSDLERSVS
jgi:glycosyltransferase involved in cell wall biosynthesis